MNEEPVSLTLYRLCERGLKLAEISLRYRIKIRLGLILKIKWLGLESREKIALPFKTFNMCTRYNVSAGTSVEQTKQKFPGVSHMLALQLSAFIVHLFVANFGTNLPFLPTCLPSFAGCCK